MQLSNLGTMGAVGETLALLGIAVLWTYRVPATEWLREMIDIWRGEISGNDPLLVDRKYMRTKPRRPRGALIMIGALALVFIGQILLILDLTF